MYSYRFPEGNEDPACRAVLSGDIGAIGTLSNKRFEKMVARTSLLVPATPLHLAAERGDEAVIRALCGKGVDWNTGDRYGRSPLQLAVMSGRAKAVELLLDHGADPNFGAEDGASPFIVACATAPQIALRMIEKGYTPRGEALSEAAVASGDMTLVKMLGEIPDWSYYDFALAADMGHTDITAYLGRKIGSVDDESREESVREAGKNRRSIREYLEKAARPLEAPERSGEIGGRRGTFTYSLESWSPWISYKSVDLSDYPVGVYVPEDYDGGKPYGLVVSMTNAKSSSRFPRHFEKTLDKHNLIWIGFDPYNGLHRIDGEANKAFCLAAVYNMLGHYNIDQSRIYIGGYSLGGQLTERILKTHSWVFDGAFFINISYAGSAPDNPSRHHCKEIPIVVMEGDYDYNRSWAYKAYRKLLCRGYDNMYFAHEPMRGHILITAESFETVISLLEEHGKEHGNP
jgi:predicted esterase